MNAQSIVEQALNALHQHAFTQHLTYISDDIILEQGTIPTVVGKPAYQAHIEQIGQLPIGTFSVNFKIVSIANRAYDAQPFVIGYTAGDTRSKNCRPAARHSMKSKVEFSRHNAERIVVESVESLVLTTDYWLLTTAPALTQPAAGGTGAPRPGAPG